MLGLILIKDSLVILDNLARTATLFISVCQAMVELSTFTIAYLIWLGTFQSCLCRSLFNAINTFG